MREKRKDACLDEGGIEVLRRQLLKDGADHLARPAPRRREVHDDLRHATHHHQRTSNGQSRQSKREALLRQTQVGNPAKQSATCAAPSVSAPLYHHALKINYVLDHHERQRCQAGAPVTSGERTYHILFKCRLPLRLGCDLCDLSGLGLCEARHGCCACGCSRCRSAAGARCKQTSQQ